MAKKKFQKKCIAEIPTKPLCYGGNDMYNEKYYITLGIERPKRKKINFNTINEKNKSKEK